MRHVKLILTLVACAYFWYCARTYMDWHLLDSVNLIFHEAGHTLFAFLGEFGRIAAGSAFQVFVPLFISLYFLYSGQPIASGLVSMWIGQSLLNVSVYARDAETMALPLLGGDSVVHDWNYLLGKLSLLDSVDVVANWILVSGFAFIVMGTIVSLYFVRYEYERFEDKASILK